MIEADHAVVPLDQRHLARQALEQRHGGRAALDAGFLQGALHHLELVVSLAEPAELGFGVAIE